MRFKRALWIVIALIVFLAPFSVGQARASAASMNKGTVRASGVNLRTQPSLESTVIMKLPNGLELTVLEAVDDWYRVEFAGIKGYISCDYVYYRGAGVIYGFVTEDDVNLRKGPGTEHEIIGKLKAGDRYLVMDINGDWFYIVNETNFGWVSKNYLLLSKNGSENVSVSILKQGMKGTAVSTMQRELKRRGFFMGDVTGEFGSETLEAVKLFQKAAKLTADGIAGDVTLKMLYDRTNGIKMTLAQKLGIKGKVKLLDWFKGGSTTFKRGMTVTVIDVRTGITFKATRFGGDYHADSEPVTLADAQKIKKAAGGSWSWNRRPIWVKIGSKYYAASMHSMPHMVDPIKNNGFPGHFCIHFYKSKVHETGRECPRHQNAVQEAYRAGN